MKKTKIKLLTQLSILVLALTISVQFIVPGIVSYIHILEKCFNKKYNLLEIKNVIDWYKIIIDNKLVGLIYIIIALILIFLIWNILFTKKQLKTEINGIMFKQKDGTHGTANFTEAEELNILNIGSEEKTEGILLGKTLKTDEIITLPDDYTSVNRNIMIWGASGSGKSTGFIIPNALKIAEQENRIKELKSMALQGKNVVCTDPKGELYSITADTFRKQGYDVKIFNLVNPEHSDGIDLIKFIDKEIDAQVFAQVVINTTQNEGKKGEEFWLNTQENLLKALLLHIKFEVDDEDKKNMRYLNSILSSRRYKEDR